MRKVAAVLALSMIAGCSDSEGDIWECERRFFGQNESIDLDFKSAEDMQAGRKLMGQFISACMVEKGYSVDVEALEGFLHGIYHLPDSLVNCESELMKLRDPSWTSTCYEWKSDNAVLLKMRGEYWVKPLAQRLGIDSN